MFRPIRNLICLHRFAKQARGLFIQTHDTPNPSALIFSPADLPDSDNRLPSSPMEFVSPKSSISSPLAQRLFEIQGIRNVFIQQSGITVTKEEEIEWKAIKPDIFGAIMDWASSQQPAIRPSTITANTNDGLNTEVQDDETIVLIKELLDTRIRPAIQNDGGDVQFVSFNKDTGTLGLRLQGACRTCDSSVITLKNGIESMVKFYVDGVERVINVEDDAEIEGRKVFEEVNQRIEQLENHQTDK